MSNRAFKDTSSFGASFLVFGNNLDCNITPYDIGKKAQGQCLKQFQNIPIGYHQHQRQKNRHTGAVDDGAYFRTDGRAFYFFYEQEQQSSAVQSRKRQNIDNGQINGKKGDKTQKINKTEFRRVAGYAGYAHRTGDGAKPDIALDGLNDKIKQRNRRSDNDIVSHLCPLNYGSVNRQFHRPDFIHGDAKRAFADRRIESRGKFDGKISRGG